jgi:hypothetical protein
MLFFLIVKGDKLGEAHLPFQLAFFPFKSQVLMLALCLLYILLLRGLNLFRHEKPTILKFGKWSAMVLLCVSIIAIAWGGWILIQNPDLLPSGQR